MAGFCRLAAASDMIWKAGAWIEVSIDSSRVGGATPPSITINPRRVRGNRQD
jgi:hypothetical protein